MIVCRKNNIAQGSMVKKYFWINCMSNFIRERKNDKERLKKISGM